MSVKAVLKILYLKSKTLAFTVLLNNVPGNPQDLGLTYLNIHVECLSSATTLLLQQLN
jgi:hypothetical protein